MLPGCYTYFGMNDSQTLPEQQRNQAIRRGHPLCAEEIMKQGFDHQKYLEAQSKHILERVQGWDKLYLEFGGKLMLDTHAQRCLPGYQENAKLELLATLKDSAEIIICVHAGDIERNKVRGDLGITYGMDVLRLIDDLRSYDLTVNSVLITRYEDQPAAKIFGQKLENRGIRTYYHRPIKGYPSDVDAIVSDSGYGANEYIETTKPIVVVTAPGPGSGKLATCLSQLYHEHKRNRKAGYAKFETFPVWNIPLKHPLNVAYEAATADLKDFNMLDSFHLDAHGITAVNYNRDMEMFPVIKRIIERITGTESIYQSPTDMGVNCIAAGIIDDAVVQEASRQEIIRRYFKTACDYKLGTVDEDTWQRMRFIMEGQGLKPEDRQVVAPTRAYLEQVRQRLGKTDGVSATGIQLDDGTIITGRNSELMTASAAAILNAVKYLANIPDEMHLLPPIIIEPILDLKIKALKNRHHVLGCEEILTALSISAVTNPLAATAMDRLCQLDGCQAHSTCFITGSDEQVCSRLGMNITCDNVYMNHSLYYTM